MQKPGGQIAIVDYGMGNLFSVRQACAYFGYEAEITHDKEKIINAAALILPGVGAFGDAMINLRKFDLVRPIKDFINTGRPFLGICLGMQLLFSVSEEFGRHEGLDILKGRVVRFINEPCRLKVPFVGWNPINRIFENGGSLWNDSPLSGISDGEFMYFVHSYHCVPDNKEIVLSVSNYGGLDYCSSIISGNIFACQFHPEKSSIQGLIVYKNWLAPKGKEKRDVIR